MQFIGYKKDLVFQFLADIGIVIQRPVDSGGRNFEGFSNILQGGTLSWSDTNMAVLNGMVS
ncbi:MAG: hypothetical protein QM731_15700 [Chitinophagaceae bacterium]